MDDVKVFSLTANKELVEEICGYLDIEPGKIDIKHFADGETLVQLGESVRGKKVYIVQSTCKPVNENLMELLVAIDACKRASAEDIFCVIPYFGYARQDRKAEPRQPITARLVADLLKAAGANRVVAVDLHASQIQGFFSFPVDDLKSVPMMGQYFRSSGLDLSNVVVVSPDHGGATRARNLANTLDDAPIAIIDKRRPRANVCEALSVIGDVKGKDCIVIDDMCDTGGSLVAACQILKDNGAKSVRVCIAHGIFSGEAIERIENSVIEELVCTNTIPLSEENRAKTTKIKVLSVGRMLAKIIAAVSTHHPISEVYDLFTENQEQIKIV